MGALFQARHDFHHAFFHRRIDVFAAARALHALQAIGDDLAHGGIGAGRRMLHFLQAPALQHRQQLRPELAVLAARALQEDEALDGDRQADGHDQDARVDGQAAVLEKLYG